MIHLLMATLLACGSSATLSIQLTVEGGVTPPEGVASLARREVAGDVDEDGTVLVPDVTAFDYGEIRYGEEVEIEVPEGWIVLDVLGFDDSGACGEIEDVHGGACLFSGWEGNAFVWVGDGRPPAQYMSPDLSVAPGEAASLDLLVREGCLCDE